MNRWI